MPKNNWYVITGGPSSGKTTLIEELKKIGHMTVGEAARLVIDEGIANGLTIKDIRHDERKFQDEVLKRKLAMEKGHNRQTLSFFDRGVHDTLAYLRFYGWELDEKLKLATQKSLYRQVFLLEPIPKFKKDYARTEDKNFANRLTKLLHDVYSEAGMVPIRVPVMEPADRALFILDYVQNSATTEEIIINA